MTPILWGVPNLPSPENCRLGQLLIPTPTTSPQFCDLGVDWATVKVNAAGNYLKSGWLSIN